MTTRGEGRDARSLDPGAGGFPAAIGCGHADSLRVAGRDGVSKAHERSRFRSPCRLVRRWARRTDITYLTAPEVTALLHAPDQTTPTGRRDHALIQVAVTTGLRVSELTGLRRGDVHLGTGAHVLAHGKGRKDRTTPLDHQSVTILRALLTAAPTTSDGFVFTTRTGTRKSRDAVAARLTLHADAAAASCPSLTGKTITPHVLRHTAAMRLLTAGIDSTVIALWLGHESIDTTKIYLHADLATKENALARTTPTGAASGRYHPEDDTLLAFLQTL